MVLSYARNQPGDECCAIGQRIQVDVLVEGVGAVAERTQTI
jgi:hypothetical protein